MQPTVMIKTGDKGGEIMRASGILLPIASLPSKYGIGAFSESAYRFIDCLKKAGQKYWQILPVGPTGYGNSPYQSFSTFAGNPYFIDPETLIEEGLLTRQECGSYDFGEDPCYIDYGKIYLSRFDMLRRAFAGRNIRQEEGLSAFREENSFWLEDYALYMAIKDSLNGLSLCGWPEELKLRKTEAMEDCRRRLRYDCDFYVYLQYLFYKQWRQLKSYANKQGIKIIGDIPIYVAYDSADTWSHPELFQLDGSLNPIAVAGCPPDAFSAEGQLWGNPLYRWRVHRSTGFDWWLKRISHSLKLYDAVRIDHFKGFDEYYSIPCAEATAVNGHWEKGPGYRLFREIREGLGRPDIIAEDLGNITDSVRKLLKRSGYPGMKVLEFAFDSGEENEYLPHNYEKNCVVYTGTHDNDTILGWFCRMDKAERRFALNYLNKRSGSTAAVHWDFIRLAMQSVADRCIIPLQDYLGLGSEARMNIPSTIGDNWTWRLREDTLEKKLLRRIRKITKLYGRI